MAEIKQLMWINICSGAQDGLCAIVGPSVPVSSPHVHGMNTPRMGEDRRTGRLGWVSQTGRHDDLESAQWCAFDML